TKPASSAGRKAANATAAASAIAGTASQRRPRVRSIRGSSESVATGCPAQERVLLPHGMLRAPSGGERLIPGWLPSRPLGSSILRDSADDGRVHRTAEEHGSVRVHDDAL